MAKSKIVKMGTALKVCSFVEEVDSNGRVVITVSDEKGNPECNGFGATQLEAVKDLKQKGYQIVIHQDQRNGKNTSIWKTHNP
jgi:hypothetical protein